MNTMADNPVTVQELLAFEPFTTCDCLAGWPGRNNAVPSVVRIESVQEAESLAGTLPDRGALVFIDLRLLNPAELIRALNALSAAAGIVVFGSSRPSLDPCMPASLNERAIPLLYTAATDAYTQAEDLLRLLAAMKQSGRFAYFTQSSVYSSLKNIGYPACLTVLEQKINNPVLALSSAAAQNETPAQILPSDKDSGLIGLLYAQAAEKLSADGAATEGWSDTLVVSDNQELHYYCLPLYSESYHYGFLAVPEQNGGLCAMDRIYLEAAGKIVLEHFIHTRNLVNAEKKHQADFIHDLLYNNFESKDDIINRGKYWGFDLSVAHQLLVIEPDWAGQKISLTDLMNKIQSFAHETVGFSGCQPIISQIQEQVVLMVPESYFKNKNAGKDNAFSLASALHRKLKKHLPAVSFAIGIGRCYPSVLDLARSFQEAKISLELGKLIYDKNHIAHFEDLGVVRLLASIDFLQLDDFYKEYLNNVIDYDQQNETNLLETLMLYYKYNGDVNTIAPKMYVHPNSLRNRLKKIEELTHTDLKNYEDLLNLFVACKIASMK